MQEGHGSGDPREGAKERSPHPSHLPSQPSSVCFPVHLALGDCPAPCWSSAPPPSCTRGPRDRPNSFRWSVASQLWKVSSSFQTPHSSCISSLVPRSPDTLSPPSAPPQRGFALLSLSVSLCSESSRYTTPNQVPWELLSHLTWKRRSVSVQVRQRQDVMRPPLTREVGSATERRQESQEVLHCVRGLTQ